jgi:hypothetical protein
MEAHPGRSDKKCARQRQGDELVKERTARLASVQPASLRAALKVVPVTAELKAPPLTPRSASPSRSAHKGEGIEVKEDELGQITAQRMYRMRCECGRPWFELELPRLVQCPACRRLNLVSV